MLSNMQRLFLLSAVLLLFSSCRGSREVPEAPYAQNEKRQHAEYDFSTAYWKKLESKQLNVFIPKAIRQSPAVQTSKLNVEKAEANAKSIGAQLYPALSGTLSAQKSDSNLGDSEKYSAGATLSWALDIWGGISAVKRSALADVEAARASYEQILLDQSRKVSEAWLDCLLAKQLLDVASERQELSAEILENTRERREMGLINDSVYQQSVRALNLAGVNRIGMQNRFEQAKYRLGLLMGIEPDALPEIESAMPDIVVRRIDSIPASVVLRRPDVRSAIAGLLAARERVTTAWSLRLPNLALSGSYNASSNEVKSVFDNWTTALVASLTGPIFDAGKRKADQEVAEKGEAIAEQNLKATSLEALYSVEMALTNYKSSLSSLNDQEMNHEAARRIFEDATRRYENGSLSRTDWLNAKLSLLQSRDAYLQAGHACLTAWTSLGGALGGSWLSPFIYQGEQSEEK